MSTIEPMVLLFQETMIEVKKDNEVMRDCMKDWSMESIDAVKRIFIHFTQSILLEHLEYLIRN